MEENYQLVKVYAGTDGSVSYLKDKLEKQGILSIVWNDFQDEMMADFSGENPLNLDLYIQETDLQKAKPIVEAISQSMEI